ncbi:MAG: hypothetical protein HY900_19145 [Deltaproteobacteria bacterium]|nr:hypothetical protein [Deltaproteobacteria bacterium]
MNDLIVGLDSDLDGIENNADDDIDGDGLLDANDNDDDGDGVLDVDEADNAAAVDPAHDGNDADGVDAVGGIMDASPLVMGVAGNPAAQNAGSKVTARAALLQTVEHIDRWPALKAVSEDTDWDGFPDAIGPAEPPDITDADVAAATAAGLVEDGDLDGDTFPNATDLRPRDPTRH